MYSNGKTASCIVVGILVGRGLLNYGEMVSTYWPEFGCNGKEDILLEDVLRHEAGLDTTQHIFSDQDFKR